ncbi:MAG: serine/threonine-protein phosphatase [Acidobacteria bacterium]|nr:serine/threonine-protein phosphatase [Acidobacteriota bacterium]
MSDDLAFNIAVYAKTNVGRVRQGNEDNFLVLNLSTADTWTPHATTGEPAAQLTTFNQSHYGSLFAVSDGMGGALAGEVASSLAVDFVRDRMLEIQASPSYSKFPFHERLRLSLELANTHIHEQSLSRPEYAGMGATFTSIGLQGNTAFFAQVGDSRAYLIREGRIQQVTRDQSLVGQLVEAGHITEEEAERHTYKNVILQALGAAPNINIVVDKLDLRDMDIVVLCSDGLSNKVRMEEIRQIIHDAPSLKDACDAMIELANHRGGEDNITIIIAQFSGGRLSTATMPLNQTEPLTSGDEVSKAEPHDRWGAQTIPRDPRLPYEISQIMIEEEEDTIKPTSRLN